MLSKLLSSLTIIVFGFVCVSHADPEFINYLNRTGSSMTLLDFKESIEVESALTPALNFSRSLYLQGYRDYELFVAMKIVAKGFSDSFDPLNLGNKLNVLIKMIGPKLTMEVLKLNPFVFEEANLRNWNHFLFLLGAEVKSRNVSEQAYSDVIQTALLKFKPQDVREVLENKEARRHLSEIFDQKARQAFVGHNLNLEKVGLGSYKALALKKGFWYADQILFEIMTHVFPNIKPAEKLSFGRWFRERTSWLSLLPNIDIDIIFNLLDPFHLGTLTPEMEERVVQIKNRLRKDLKENPKALAYYGGRNLSLFFSQIVKADSNKVGLHMKNESVLHLLTSYMNELNLLLFEKLFYTHENRLEVIEAERLDYYKTRYIPDVIAFTFGDSLTPKELQERVFTNKKVEAFIEKWAEILVKDKVEALSIGYSQKLIQLSDLASPLRMTAERVGGDLEKFIDILTENAYATNNMVRGRRLWFEKIAQNMKLPLRLNVEIKEAGNFLESLVIPYFHSYKQLNQKLFFAFIRYYNDLYEVAPVVRPTLSRQQVVRIAVLLGLGIESGKAKPLPEVNNILLELADKIHSGEASFQRVRQSERKIESYGISADIVSEIIHVIRNPDYHGLASSRNQGVRSGKLLPFSSPPLPVNSCKRIFRGGGA